MAFPPYPKLLPWPSLGPLGPVLGTPLAPIGHPRRVQGSPDDVVPHPRQVLDPAPADQNHRVLLQGVALTRDVRGHLNLIAEANPGHLAQRGVGLLRGYREDTRANAALLGRSLGRHRGPGAAVVHVAERRSRHPAARAPAWLANQLVDGRHPLDTSSRRSDAHNSPDHRSGRGAHIDPAAAPQIGHRWDPDHLQVPLPAQLQDGPDHLGVRIVSDQDQLGVLLLDRLQRLLGPDRPATSSAKTPFNRRKVRWIRALHALGYCSTVTTGCQLQLRLACRRLPRWDGPGPSGGAPGPRSFPKTSRRSPLSPLLHRGV